MARSSNWNFAYTRDNIINHAFRLIGVLGEDQTASSTRLTQGGQALNMMIKLWQAQGIGLWLNKDVILIPQADTVQYYLGPGADSTYGTFCCLKDDFHVTTLDGAVTASDFAISVDSLTGGVVGTTGYYIGVVTDNGDVHWSLVDSCTDYDITLSTALDYNASDGAYVYYSSDWSIQRPLELISAVIHDENNIDVPLEIFSMQEYRSLANKTTEAKPTSVCVDWLLDLVRLYVWPEPYDMRQYLDIRVKYPVQDFDAATDNADFPAEWTEALTYNLAVRLAAEYGRTPSPLVTALAMQSYETLMGFDREQVSVRFKPNTRDYRAR